ncbi:hypothetical protein POM88_040673 [Heracleum sosnowskyi]|uniref:Protein FAR1-RELATED SEQUENCE n=1 Tax=Heracleum sosnowskyi TaxID=360622 RepID=A0AAD8HFD4_9APIA|nr:hypothetical protein POM88_040673 [Heracleum sosnowskyi]
MRSNRHMPAAAKSLVETFRKENLPVGKVSSVFCGEYVGFDDRDCYNHLRNVRHRQLDMGDAQWVLNYFRKKQSENPQFFYAIQCDENDRATNSYNIFLVDIIPDHFILPRWRQEANKFRVTELQVLEKDGNAEESKTLRLGHISDWASIVGLSSRREVKAFNRYEQRKKEKSLIAELQNKKKRVNKIAELEEKV